MLFSPCSDVVNGILLPARLPNLNIVIMLDSKLPGTFHMDEVMQAGDSSHMKQLRAVQQTLSCNEPINIQFTSVGAPACSMPCGWGTQGKMCGMLSIPFLFPSAP